MNVEEYRYINEQFDAAISIEKKNLNKRIRFIFDPLNKESAELQQVVKAALSHYETWACCFRSN